MALNTTGGKTTSGFAGACSARNLHGVTPPAFKFRRAVTGLQRIGLVNGARCNNIFFHRPIIAHAFRGLSSVRCRFWGLRENIYSTVQAGFGGEESTRTQHAASLRDDGAACPMIGRALTLTLSRQAAGEGIVTPSP